MRALVVERIDELAEAEEAEQVDAWQRSQAWPTWERLRAGERSEVSRAELAAVFKRVSAAKRR